MRVFLLMGFIFGCWGSLSAQPLQVLDSDYFNDNFNSAPTNGVQVLNPDFFRSRRGLLTNAEPGEYGCLPANGASELGESAAVGRIGRDFCEGTPQRVWVPRSYGPTPFQNLPAGGYSTPYSNQVKGSWQICCFRKGGRHHRKIGPKP